MRLAKVNFNGYLFSDLCIMLENRVSDTCGMSTSEIEELVTTSDDLCPADINRCEYVVMYWWQLRDYLVHLECDELIVALDLIQTEEDIERDTLIFCQV